MDNELRITILELLRKNPKGLTSNQLEQELELEWTQITPTLYTMIGTQVRKVREGDQELFKFNSY